MVSSIFSCWHNTVVNNYVMNRFSLKSALVRSLMIGALLVVLTFVNAMYYKDYQTALLRGIYLKDGLSYLEANRWSVPIVSDWNGDGKKDLLIGNRMYGKDRNINQGYVSFYENMGTDGSPSFSGSVYIRSCRETCTSLTVAADG
jgi:hypothetical protein